MPNFESWLPPPSSHMSTLTEYESNVSPVEMRRMVIAMLPALLKSTLRSTTTQKPMNFDTGFDACVPMRPPIEKVPERGVQVMMGSASSDLIWKTWVKKSDSRKPTGSLNFQR